MKKICGARFCVELREAIQKHCDDAMVEVGAGLPGGIASLSG